MDEKLLEIGMKQRERYKKQNELGDQVYDRLSFTVPKGKKNEIKRMANEKNMSLSAFLSDVVLKTLGIQESAPETIQNAQRTPENPKVEEITEPEQKPLKTEQEKQKELQDIYRKKRATMDAWRQKEADKKEQEKEQRKRDMLDIVDSMRASADGKREKDREKYRQFTDSDIDELLAGDGLAYFLNPENPGTLLNMIGTENFKRLQDAARQRINAKNLEGLSL